MWGGWGGGAKCFLAQECFCANGGDKQMGRLTHGTFCSSSVSMGEGKFLAPPWRTSERHANSSTQSPLLSCFVNLDPMQQNSNFLGFNKILTHIPFSETATHSSSSSRLPEVLCFKPSPKILVQLLSFSSYKWFMRSDGGAGIIEKQQILFPAPSPHSTPSQSIVIKAITNHSKHHINVSPNRSLYPYATMLGTLED